MRISHLQLSAQHLSVNVRRAEGHGGDASADLISTAPTGQFLSVMKLLKAFFSNDSPRTALFFFICLELLRLFCVHVGVYLYVGELGECSCVFVDVCI